MGCFLGCFGGEKDQKRRRRRVNRGSPQRHRNRVQNIHLEKTVISEPAANETKTIAEESTKETIPISEQPAKETIAISEQSTKETVNIKNSVRELKTKPEIVEQKSPSPSPRKRVTFNSNVTTYEHVQVYDSIESLSEFPTDIEKEKEHECFKTKGQSNSISSEDSSAASSVASYPPNHRYHNARESDDETEEYANSDLDDDDDDLDSQYDEEGDYEEYDEDIDARIPGHDIWSEPIFTELAESMTGKNPFSEAAEEEEEVESGFIGPGGPKGNGRDRSDYINSVLNPVENITQWKAAKLKGTNLLTPPQKENLTAANNLEPPCVPVSLEPTFKKKADQSRKNGNREVAVDASLSNWLSSPEVTPPKKTSNFGGFDSNASEGRNSVRSFEDRPILGALTVEELRQLSASNSPRKSPRSPDEMPIIGTVGTYWNDLISKKHS